MRETEPGEPEPVSVIVHEDDLIGLKINLYLVGRGSRLPQCAVVDVVVLFDLVSFHFHLLG